MKFPTLWQKSEAIQNHFSGGFVPTVSDDTKKPKCVLCVQVPSAESVKLSALERHLESERNDYKDKDLPFFEHRVNCVKRFRTDTSGAF